MTSFPRSPRTDASAQPTLPITRLVPPPVRARRVGAAVAAGFFSFTLLAGLMPWVQTVSGSGGVTTYAPRERQQTVEAPIDGRVTRVHVAEGMHVSRGSPLVDLADVDPERLARLASEVALGEQRVASYEARVASLQERLDAVGSLQEGALRGAEARQRAAADRADAAGQSVASAEAELEAAILNLARHRVLTDQGLASQRDLELAIATEARTRAARDAARASRDAAQADLFGARAALDQARGARSAEIESAISALRSAETDLQGASAALLRAQTALARQQSQQVLAPRDGVILRVEAWPDVSLVRAGDTLVTLVPRSEDRSVELWVDGNDAAIISPGSPVRLQFEGWPAVQFVGWPSVAVGTFGGRVAFIDGADDGRGNFRVMVLPDPEDEPWPETRFLRLGVRANGWILLNEVPIWFELWRQINGFPPSLSRPPRRSPGGGSYGSGSYEDEGGYGGYGGGGS